MAFICENLRHLRSKSLLLGKIGQSHPSHRSLPHKVTCIKDGFFFCDALRAGKLTADNTDERRLKTFAVICEKLRHLWFTTGLMAEHCFTIYYAFHGD